MTDIHPLDNGQELLAPDGTEVTDPEERFALFTILGNAPLEALRHERDVRLAATDWWANSDVPMTEERRAYRQALRDITKTYSSPNDVVWPEKPA